MARRPRVVDPESDLNLAPMMNLVIILIPMLLLSVVFLEVGVINITAPTLSVGAPSEPKDEPEEQPLNLTVAISANGFQIAATGVVLPARAGCPTQGPTICLDDQNVDVSAKFEEARRIMSAGSEGGGEDVLKQGLAAYSFRELYNQLSRIKKEYPKETIITLSADADVPYAVLVRVMDVARFQLEKDSYDTASDFWSATAKTEGNAYSELFSDPVLSILQ
ncbi:MAG: biopolymer transporter ExbD [Bradymonadaceae bacterium]|nr:biopolymer transporter ExbD [Lujinxingiaceae bacterium]